MSYVGHTLLECSILFFSYLFVLFYNLCCSFFFFFDLRGAEFEGPQGLAGLAAEAGSPLRDQGHEPDHLLE